MRLFLDYLYMIIILEYDTEPEDLSIRTKVVDKINENAELYSHGDESDTSQPISDCKFSDFKFLIIKSYIINK